MRKNAYCHIYFAHFLSLKRLIMQFTLVSLKDRYVQDLSNLLHPQYKNGKRTCLISGIYTKIHIYYRPSTLRQVRMYVKRLVRPMLWDSLFRFVNKIDISDILCKQKDIGFGFFLTWIWSIKLLTKLNIKQEKPSDLENFKI